MKKLLTAKAVLTAFLALTILGAGALVAAQKFGKPTSVIHVVTVRWKKDATPEQIKAALDGVEKVAATYPGIKNVWVKTLKVQGQGYNNAFVMEFASKEALDKYTGSEAQKEWYKAYLPIRDQSTTHDITN
ncbi:MAG: Dabb family protein [Bryobacterales bacterium]|nr:Dabb family protein [Bryobacterales bacterium]